MNYKPQSLTMSALSLAAALFAVLRITEIGLTAAQTADPAAVAAESTSPAEPSAAATDPAATPEEQPVPDQGAAVPAAEELLNQVRSRMEGLDSLKCTLHETVTMSGMKFHAAGSYVQASGNRVRLEFRISPVTPGKSGETVGVPLDTESESGNAADVAGRESSGDDEKSGGSLTQVSDGSVLYSYLQNGKEGRVTRRNINSILKAAGESKVYDPTRAMQDLGLGGLNALIARIQTSMEFSRVKREKIGNTEFLVVVGRWNSRFRKEVFQLQNDTDPIPQDFIPDYVRIYVDEASSLPRRIQYVKRTPDPKRKEIRPLVTLDLRKIVLNEAVDDSVFVFKAPENVPEEDITEQTIKGILQAASPPAPATGESVTAPIPATESSSNEPAAVPESSDAAAPAE